MKKRIDLYPAPHVEVRLHVSDEMIEDYRKCKQNARKTHDGGTACEGCSWDCTEFRGIAACELVMPEQVLKGDNFEKGNH